MKTKFKFLIVFAFVFLLSAQVAAARDYDPRVAEKAKMESSKSGTSTSSASYCAEIDSLAAKILMTISEQEKNYRKLSMDRTKELVERRSSQALTESNRRTVWDENRNEHFKLLEGKSKSVGEKKALASFKVSIEKAVAARKISVDAAHAAFKTASDKALKDRMGIFNTATSTFKGAVDRAVVKAKAECLQTQKSNTARDAFRIALKDARMAFENNIKNLSVLNVDAAIKIRNTALEKAQKDFAAAVDKALKEFKISTPSL